MRISDWSSDVCSSDLGDAYVINGQKIWTTQAQHADWMFALVRTDNSGRKQQGITFLLIDMKTPGITVRPTETIAGGRDRKSGVKGKSVSIRVELGGRRIIKKKKTKKNNNQPIQ